MEVIVMTDNFGKKIEGNGWGTMYHGKLRTGQEVAVKVWPLGAPSAVVEFHEFEAVRTLFLDQPMMSHNLIDPLLIRMEF